MMHRFYIIKPTLLLSLAILSFHLNAQDSQRPNIIYIMSDDHDADAISSYNPSLIQTPNIDRLAKEGIRFTNSFVSNSICSPARATILSGKFSHLNGVKDNRTPFDTSQYTFIKQLKSNGYQTAIVGKWHLHITPSGFDYWKILQGQGFYYKPIFISGKDTISYPDKYATEVITEDAIRWISNRDKLKPFVLMMHHKAPHREWFPTLANLKKFSAMKFPEPATLLFSDTARMGTAFRKQKMGIYSDMRLTVDLKIDPAYIRDIPHLKPTEAEEKFYYSLMSRLPKEIRAEAEKIYGERGKILRERKPEKQELLKLKYQWYMQDYLACVASVDESVGTVLDYLETNKLRDNTIIIYTSDQGFYLGENGWFDKRFMYDVSMQSPLLISWKGKIKSGVRTEMVQNIDYVPTFLHYAKVTIPSDAQGLSLKPILENEKNTLKRNSLYYHYYEFPWDHNVYPHLGIRTKEYKLIYFYTVNEWELYNLKNDPGEMKNLASSPKHQTILRKLKEELALQRANYKDIEPAGVLH